MTETETDQPEDDAVAAGEAAPEPVPEPEPNPAVLSAAANAAFDEMADDDMGDLSDLADEEGVVPEDIDPEHVRLLEAVLFASSEPVAERTLARRLPEGTNVKPLLNELRGFYDGRGVYLVRRGGSWAFRTAPDLGQRLNLEVEVSRRLSRAAIETLAIIAYHQPVTRGEVEEIRGVSLSKGTLDLLFDEGWIKPRGHRDSPGRPMQWGTTDSFLDHFGLESVSQLPGLKDLRAMGLLDSRPAIDAYTVRGAMQTSEEAQENLDFNESEIVSAEHHMEDDDVTVGPLHPLDAAPETEPEPQVELDQSGASKATAAKLDAAMSDVAYAVKSAVKALEKDDEDEDEDDADDVSA